MEGVSEAFRDLAQQGPGFTLAVMTGLLVLGLVILILGWKREHLPELGIGLIVGGLFAFSSYANQVAVELNGFKSQLAFSQDLSGFDSNGYDLSGVNLTSKKLQGANLANAKLSGANLSYSDLREARLRHADLHDASLFYLQGALRADLIGADLRGANLQGAKITTSAISGTRLTGATVHGETCWTIPLDNIADGIPDEDGARVLETVVKGGLKPNDGATLGRLCGKTEVGGPLESKAPGPSDLIRVCVAEPHLVRGTCG